MGRVYGVSRAGQGWGLAQPGWCFFSESSPGKISLSLKGAWKMRQRSILSGMG